LLQTGHVRARPHRDGFNKSDTLRVRAHEGVTYTLTALTDWHQPDEHQAMIPSRARREPAWHHEWQPSPPRPLCRTKWHRRCRPSFALSARLEVPEPLLERVDAVEQLRR
jgi:hypothetical protein